MKLKTIFILATLITSPLMAADETPTSPPPPLPDEPLPEPEVTIIHGEDKTIEEYRVNGQVRFVKITPKKGKPYYMIDTDGDGQLDKRDDNLDNPPINQWILLRW